MMNSFHSLPTILSTELPTELSIKFIPFVFNMMNSFHSLPTILLTELPTELQMKFI